MKKMRFLGIIALVAVIGFGVAACKNDTEEEGDGIDNGGGGGNNGGTINPQGANVYLEDGNLLSSGINGKVMLYIVGNYNSEDDYFEMIPTPIGNITNGKLSFTLPDVSAYAVYGYSLEEEFRDKPEGYTETDEYGSTTYKVHKNTVKLNPQDAKTLWGVIYFIYDNKEYELFLDDNVEGEVLYLYLNKPATLKGEFSETRYNSYSTSSTYNCDFKAGWNIVYDTGYNGIYNLSTNPPVNAASMRWILCL
jgi:predicted small secreted protein